MEQKKLGETIRELRISKKMKVYELAKLVGVNAVYITQIEKHDKLPSPELIQRIAEALETDLAKLKYKYTIEKIYKLDHSKFFSPFAPGKSSPFTNKDLSLLDHIIIKNEEITDRLIYQLIGDLNPHHSDVPPDKKYVDEIKKLLKNFKDTYSKLRHLIIETKYDKDMEL